MRVTVGMPDLYRSLHGKTKKRYAWAYLRRYYPSYVPTKDQERLETDNVLICDIDFTKQRQLLEEANARRSAKKGKKRR